MTTLLPAEFADLEPYAETWCLTSEPERWARRQATSMDDLQAFYDACFPRAEDAIRYCDRFDLDGDPRTGCEGLEFPIVVSHVAVNDVMLRGKAAATGAVVIDCTALLERKRGG